MSKHKEAAIRICECLGIDGPFFNNEAEEYYEFVEGQLKQVERETWLEAARVVRNQYGVSHWTEEDTVELLESKAKEVGDE